MSYKLVNANDLVISYPEVNINSFPCIFADLPNGLDGGHYDLTLPTDVNIDLIRDEIELMIDNGDWGDSTLLALRMVLKMIDRKDEEK